MKKHSSNSLLKGILWGAAFGVAVALLTAPRKGSDNRKAIKAYLDRLANKTQNSINAIDDKITGLAEENVSKLKRQLEKARHTDA